VASKIQHLYYSSICSKLHAVLIFFPLLAAAGNMELLNANQPSSRRYPTSGAWLDWGADSLTRYSARCTLATRLMSSCMAVGVTTTMYLPSVDRSKLSLSLSLSLYMCRVDGQLWTRTPGDTTSRQRRMGRELLRCETTRQGRGRKWMMLMALDQRAEELNSSNGMQAATVTASSIFPPANHSV
jgi:hypothetical protein